jgi:hypothetical protein
MAVARATVRAKEKNPQKYQPTDTEAIFVWGGRRVEPRANPSGGAI